MGAHLTKWTRGTTALAGAMLVAGCIPPGAVRGDSTPRPAATAGRGAEIPGPNAPRIDPAPLPALPAQTPAWEARAVRPDAVHVPASIYTVRPGDTLRRISERTGAASEAIARANGIAPPFTIYAGQQLTIPGGRYHLIRQGETGIAIARAYGVDWSRIVAANALEEPYILRTGQRILIPDTTPMTLAQRAEAFKLDIDDIVTGGEPAIAQNAQPARPAPTATRTLPASAAVAEPARLTGRFLWPVHGTIVKRFGPGASGERNDGIKIAVPLDTPVLAAADGTVAYVGGDIPALGGIVIIKHGDGWATVYGHADKVLVKRGQAVKQGQKIALSGDSGFADRPELHFEIRHGRTPVDPLSRLPAS